MNKSNQIGIKFRFALKIILIITLILGIMSSTFGIGVAAITSIKNNPKQEQTTPDGTVPETEEQEFIDPIEEYDDLPDEMTLNEDVKIIDKHDSNIIVSSISNIEQLSSYYNDSYTKITLNGENIPELDNISEGEIFFIQGDSDNVLSGDRAYKLLEKYSDEENTYIEVDEPEFEEVFESIEYSATDYLTEENFVGGYGLPGVSISFPDNNSASGVSTNPDSVKAPTAQTLSVNSDNKPEVSQTNEAVSAGNTNFKIEIDLDFAELLKKDDDKDKDSNYDNGFDWDFGIKGTIDFKDFATHVVFDVPSITKWNNCYIGQSGTIDTNLDFYGKAELKVETVSRSRDLKIASLEGLKEKSFPFYIMQFNGITPVVIPKAVFDAATKTVIPNLFLVLYMDWQGNVSIELTAGFESSYTFNSGISVVENGSIKPKFVDHLNSAHDEESTLNNSNWHGTLSFKAECDVTVLGGGLLVYIAGINMADISLVRIGLEGKCDVDLLKFGKGNNDTIFKDENAEYYLRMYIKLICMDIKFKIQGKGIAQFLNFDLDFKFTLLDVTLFRIGTRSDYFGEDPNISTKRPPGEFDSVFMLVTDASGSMSGTVGTGETKLHAAKEAAKQLITFSEGWSKSYNQVLGVGIVQFGNDAKTVANAHTDYPYLSRCVDTIRDGGGTDIQSGLDTAISELSSLKAGSKFIILMSDGQQTEGNAMTAANTAASKGIMIYTIGFGSDADSSLLSSIASTTGGTYTYASTDNMTNIAGGFLLSQIDTEADILSNFSDSVAEGETSSAKTFSVSDKNGDLIATTTWPGSFLDTILIDPNGRVVDEDYPNAYTDESQIPSIIRVVNPIPGKWKVKVKGVETSYEKEPFYTIIAFKDTDNVEINKAMTDLEKAAAICIPIGIFTTLASAMLLICIGKKKNPDISE